jgi:hypothetical protein
MEESLIAFQSRPIHNRLTMSRMADVAAVLRIDVASLVMQMNLEENIASDTKRIRERTRGRHGRLCA